MDISDFCPAARKGLDSYAGWMHQAQAAGDIEFFVNHGLGFIAMKASGAGNDSGHRLETILLGFLYSAGCTPSQAKLVVKHLGRKDYGLAGGFGAPMVFVGW